MPGQGRRRALQPARTAGVREPPGAGLRPLHHDRCGTQVPRLRADPGCPRLPVTRVLLAHPGLEGIGISQPSRFATPHLQERGVHTTPKLVSAARKTSKKQPPPPIRQVFAEKASGPELPGTAASELEAFTFLESGSAPHRSHRPFTYSPGPC